MFSLDKPRGATDLETIRNTGTEVCRNTVEHKSVPSDRIVTMVEDMADSISYKLGFLECLALGKDRQVYIHRKR